MTGGRVKRIQKYVGNEPFILTYGDGVCDINIQELSKYVFYGLSISFVGLLLIASVYYIAHRQQ